MRFNEAEVVSALAFTLPDWEGRLRHKAPSKSGNSEYKERWIRLKANFLFIWRLESHRQTQPPSHCLLLERSHAQQEFHPEGKHTFSIIFADDGNKHTFVADSDQGVKQWLTALKAARYEQLRKRLITLRCALKDRTGRDPLLGTLLQNSPVYCTTATGDRAHHRPAPAPPPRPKKKGNNDKKASFRSHVFDSWESKREEEPVASESVSPAKSSFRSHLMKKVPEGRLIDLD